MVKQKFLDYYLKQIQFNLFIETCRKGFECGRHFKIENKINKPCLYTVAKNVIPKFQNHLFDRNKRPEELSIVELKQNLNQGIVFNFGYITLTRPSTIGEVKASQGRE